MGCFVRGDKNCMGCFVRGGKLMRDVLSGVAKNGIGCFVPGCFVLHSYCNGIYCYHKILYQTVMKKLIQVCRFFYQFLLLRNHSVTMDVFMGYL